VTARNILLGLLMGALLTVGPHAAGDAAGRAAEGERLLAAANFDGALKAYGDAAAADRADADVQQRFAILRQVVTLRGALASEPSPKKWETMTRALRSFYYEHRLYAESLPLDQQRFGRASTPESAALLAETLLELGRNSQAEAAVASYNRLDAPPSARLLYGIALARQGRGDPARTIANGVTLAEGTPADPLYHAARLQALLGRAEASTALLTRALQATSPGALATTRERARACPDFGSVASTPAFTAALETAPAASASKCSMGPSCGGCPLAKGCGQTKSSK
jgi:tetratricopeptide (TPR) repeat protein